MNRPGFTLDFRAVSFVAALMLARQFQWLLISLLYMLVNQIGVLALTAPYMRHMSATFSATMLKAIATGVIVVYALTNNKSAGIRECVKESKQ